MMSFICGEVSPLVSLRIRERRGRQPDSLVPCVVDTVEPLQEDETVLGVDQSRCSAMKNRELTDEIEALTAWVAQIGHDKVYLALISAEHGVQGAWPDLCIGRQLVCDTACSCKTDKRIPQKTWWTVGVPMLKNSDCRSANWLSVTVSRPVVSSI